MRVVLVVGGGQLGGALARQLAAAGDTQVVVASRKERPHPGWWCRLDLRDDGILRLLRRTRAAEVILACGPLPSSELQRTVDTLRGTRTTAVVPLPAAHELKADCVVGVGPLFGGADACLAPLLPVLRDGGVARHRSHYPPSRPLYVEDAARAVLRLRGLGGTHQLTGPERWAFADLVGALARRFGGRCAPRLFGRANPEQIATLQASDAGHDTWDNGRLGPRRPYLDWVERLPGPRRGR